MRIAHLVHVVCMAAVTALAQSTTGDSHCGSGYCLTAAYNPTAQNINYTLLVADAAPSKGWYSVGQGARMAGANMMVGWANADGSITTSQRGATSNRQPLMSDVTADAYQVNLAQTKLADGTLSISWLFAQTAPPDNAMAHMYALSSKSPPSSQSSAPIAIHDSYDQFNLDMTKPYDATSLAAAVPTTSTPSTMPAAMGPNRDLGDNSVRIFLVHMIFMILAWLILAPLGVLLARYGRTLFNWYPSHRLVQLGTLLAMFIGFFLSVAAMVASGAKHHFNKTHHQVGLAMLILVFIQVALGFWAHGNLANTGKRYVGFVHAPIGLLLFGLAIWNIQTGFQLWEWEAGNAAVYAVYAWMGFLILLYLAGFAFLPREIKQSRKASDEKMQLNSRDDAEGNSAGSL